MAYTSRLARSGLRDEARRSLEAHSERQGMEVQVARADTGRFVAQLTRAFTTARPPAGFACHASRRPDVPSISNSSPALVRPPAAPVRLPARPASVPSPDHGAAPLSQTPGCLRP